MAMSITHQIGTLAGTTLSTSPVNSSESSATISGAAVWKSSSPILSPRYQIQVPDPMEQKSQPTSPCRSPILSGMRADLSVACRAFTLETGTAETVGERVYGESSAKLKEKGVPVFVMMPLDSVTMGNTVNRRKAMNASLQALKSAGVEGVMMDVWWGLVEKEAPGQYNWGGYNELLEMAKRHGLKVQAVMSFHQCGGNVGDSCT